MNKRGLTVIEILIIVAILGIILGIIVSAYNRTHADPTLMNTNSAGQQTWKVPSRRLQEFQASHSEFKIVSITSIVESNGEIAETTGYMVILDPPQHAEKVSQ